MGNQAHLAGAASTAASAAIPPAEMASLVAIDFHFFIVTAFLA